MARAEESIYRDLKRQARSSSRRLKRTFDIVFALILIILISPVLLVLFVMVRLEGKPVVFSHTRVGLNGKPFECMKFRSMVPDAEQRLHHLLEHCEESREEWERDQKLRKDPRITRLGAFLRASSLDELPQLFNVLNGDMSIVGPRPIIEAELERYGNKAELYLSVRPGITGLWQVSGRNKVTYSRRVSLDALYVKRQSFLLDIWILLRTIKVVLTRHGAH